jgi:hypothetical protein
MTTKQQQNNTYKNDKNDKNDKKDNKLATITEIEKTWQPIGNQSATQVKLSEVNLSKDKLNKDLATIVAEDLNLNPLIDLFKSVNPSYQKFFANTTQRNAIERLLKSQGREKLEQIIAVLPKTNAMPYFPAITTPLQLEDKLGQLNALIQKKRVELNNKIPLVAKIK